MSINLYTGTVGSGKSFHTVAEGLEWIERGYNVVANFPITQAKSTKFKWINDRNDRRYKRWIYKPDITIEYLIALSIERDWFGTESQCLLILDEAGTIFNSRDWQVAGDSRLRWIKFFSLTRKLGYDVILVAQNDRMIDRQVRSLVEYEVKHLKANNAFMFRFLSVFRISLFMYVYKWYQTRLKGNVRLAIFKKRVADRYDTMRMFNTTDMIDNIEKMYKREELPSKVKSKLDQWKLDNKNQEKRDFANSEYVQEMVEYEEETDKQAEVGG